MLSPEEQKELEELEAMEAAGAFSDAPSQPALTPEEEAELAELEAMELELQGQNAVEDSYSNLESGAMGLAQGTSLGFADELGGAAKTAIDVVAGNASFSQISDQYKKNRDLLRKEFKEAEKDNPKSFMAGDITGGVATTLIPGLNVAKGLGAAVKVGALAGGASALGRTEEEDIQDQLVDTLMGAGFGAAAGGVGYGIGKGFDKAGKFVGEKIKSGGESELMRALGFTSMTAKKNLDRVAKSKGISNIEMLGEVIEETAPDGKAIFSPLRGENGQFTALRETVDAYGKGIAEIVGKVDDSLEIPPVNPKNLLNRLKGDLTKVFNMDSGVESKAVTKFVDDLINPDSLTEAWSLKRLWGFRKSVDSITDFGGSDALQNNIKRQARKSIENLLRENLESAPNMAVNQADELGETVLQKYLNASDKYGKLRTVQDAFYDNIILKKEGVIGALRKSIHFGGLGIGAAAGASVGGVPGMIVGGVLGRAVQQGLGGKVIGKALTKAGTVAAKNNRYAERLIMAAGRSGEAFEMALSYGEAIHDFTIEPLQRSTQAVIDNFPKINALLSEENPELAKNLQDAVESKDENLIGGLMSGVSLDAKASKYIQPGIGWDGKAISEGDIKTVESQIKGAPISSRQKAMLMQQFSSDRVIPQIEEEKPFYKVYDPSLKTSVMK
jgi:hypothetical protein